MIDRRSSLLLSPWSRIRTYVCMYVCMRVRVYIHICVCVRNDNVSFIRPSGNDCVDGICIPRLEKRTKKYKSIYIT